MLKSKNGKQTIGVTLDGLISRFAQTSDTPGLDAQVLLAHVLDKPRSWVLAHPEEPLSENPCAALEKQITRLEGGEPLPYILGTWEFYGLKFIVTHDVLIPRPETEILVERAIYWLKKREPSSLQVKVLDIGTGCGCIAISLAVNIPDISITATDISPAALVVARRNAEMMNVSDRIIFIEADLFCNPSTPESFSVIIANPPYIPTKKLLKTRIYGREPTLALDGGTDGLVLIRRILKEAPDHLIQGGLLLMEIENSERQKVLSLASEAFPGVRINLLKDLAGHNRTIEVQA